VSSEYIEAVARSVYLNAPRLRNHAPLSYALFHLCAYGLKQHSRRQVCKVLLHPVCPFEEFGGDGLSVSGLESV
jgi:hypothetical protein